MAALLRKGIGCLTLVLMLTAHSSAIDFVFDYQHDTFIFGNAPAKAALEAAAADVGAAITSQLDAITNDTFTGFNGNTHITFNWDFSYTNPESGFNENTSLATANENEVILYVGGRSMTDDSLAAASPAEITLSGGPSGSGFPEELVGAVASVESQSEIAYLRGGSGPSMGARSGSVSIAQTTASYSVDFGAAVGNLWFDVDVNNDGFRDSATELNNYWHYDHTNPAIPDNKFDFYTVALHEILHTIGFGSAQNWASFASGANWSGSEVAELAGSGIGILESDGAHIAAGTLSTRITDGVPQTPSLTKNVDKGIRKTLTALDLAFLRDIGWSTIVPAQPGSNGDYNGNGTVDAADYALWLASLGDSVPAGTGADGSGNGLVDQSDYQFWKDRFGDTAGSASDSSIGSVIPEPSTLVLIALMVLGILAHRNDR